MQAISFVASRLLLVLLFLSLLNVCVCVVAGSNRISFNAYTATLASDECMYECYSPCSLVFTLFDVMYSVAIQSRAKSVQIDKITHIHTHTRAHCEWGRIKRSGSMNCRLIDMFGGKEGT